MTITARSISESLRMLQQGAFEVECSDKLAALIKAVEETGKPGKLTIEISLKKSGAALAVMSKCTDKTPPPKVDPDMLWSTVEGHLTVQNPAQRDLDLRVAKVVKTEVRSVDPDTGEIRQASAG